MTPLKPSPDAIEVTLEKVLSSAAFRGRQSLRRLLTHVVRHSLEGNGDSLKVSGVWQYAGARRAGFFQATSGRVEAAEAILELLAASDKTRYVARSGVCQIHMTLGHLDRAAREWDARAGGR